MRRICRGGMVLLCAWLLWQEVFYDGSYGQVETSLLQASETKAECERNAVKLLQSLQQQRKGSTLEGFALRSTSGQSGVMWHLAKCLPDTIDPRRPK